MSSNEITYQYSAIQDGVQQMRSANSKIEQKVTDLNKQVKTLLASFTGDASQAYDTCANKISQDLNNSNAQLNTLSQKVDSGAQNMSSADKTAAGRFGN